MAIVWFLIWVVFPYLTWWGICLFFGKRIFSNAHKRGRLMASIAYASLFAGVLIIAGVREFNSWNILSGRGGTQMLLCFYGVPPVFLLGAWLGHKIGW